MRLKPLDAIALIGIPLAIVSMIADNTLVVGAAFFVATILVTIAVWQHEELNQAIQVGICLLIVGLFGGGFYLVEKKNLQNDLEKNIGVLYPAEDSDASALLPNCPAPKEALRVLLGGNLAWGSRPRVGILELSDRPSITIEREPDGAIRITKLEIFDDRHNVATSIDANSLWVDPSSRRERPNRSSLVVYDHNNNQILNIKFVNKTLIQITGVFRIADGSAVIFSETGTSFGKNIRFQGICAGDNGRAQFSFG